MRVLLIHGYKSPVDAGWLKRLNDDLTPRGFEVASVALDDETSLAAWMEKIGAGLSVQPEIVVAHSLGTYALLKTLEVGEWKIRKILLVAGFCREYPSPVIERLKHRFVGWFEEPIDFGKIRQKAETWFVFHSDDDDVVPIGEGKFLAEQFDARLHLLHLKHLGDELGEIEVPEVRDAILG